MSAQGQIFPAWTNKKVTQRAPSRWLSHVRASGSMNPGRVGGLKEQNIHLVLVSGLGLVSPFCQSKLFCILGLTSYA